MRVLLVGSTRLTAAVMESVTDMAGVSLVGCLTAPRQFRISYSPDPVSNVTHSDLNVLASRSGVLCRVTSHGMHDHELLEWARELAPDIILVAGWHYMLPRDWLDLAPAFGMHASLLPDLAGGAPLVWALILDRSQTGVSLFRLEAGVDSGAVVARQSFPILNTDDISDLLRKAETASVALCRQWLPKLLNKDLPFEAQDLSQQVLMPQRRPSDGEIDWSMPVAEIERFVRAQTRPYPGAFFVRGNVRTTVYGCRILRQGPPDSSFGIEHHGNVLRVYCSDGILEIDDFVTQVIDLANPDEI